MPSIPTDIRRANAPTTTAPNGTPTARGRLARAFDGIRMLPTCLACVRPPDRQPAAAHDATPASPALLSVRNAKASPMYFALQEGWAATVSALDLAHGVNAQTPEPCDPWLEARRPDGVPGLHMALALGHAEAIEAFGGVLERRDLDPTKLTRVLAARTLDGLYEPGLFMALQDGHADAIRSFGRLLGDPRLSYVQRFNLLAAGRLDGTPGLFMAMQRNRGGAVRAFGDIVLRCNPAPADLARLLDARDADGTSGLAIAMHCGNTYAIRAFGDVLEQAAPVIGGERLIALLKVDARLAADAETHRACTDILTRLVGAGHLVQDLDYEVPVDEADGPR